MSEIVQLYRNTSGQGNAVDCRDSVPPIATLSTATVVFLALLVKVELDEVVILT